MQLAHQINQKCSETLPYYAEVSTYTAEAYQHQLDRLNSLYLTSKDKVLKVSKASKQLRKDLLWMFSQAADDILQVMEKKLVIDCTKTKEKGKIRRLQRIYSQLKEHRLLPYVKKVIEFEESLMARGRSYHQRYLVPLFVTLKATLLVSRQMFFEVFADRISKLKMTYQCSKDSITMFWSGEFKEEKILEKVKENLGSFKQFTINFVQKGMEIKISRQDLIENYHHVMEKLSDIIQEVSSKSVEQWATTKTKTIDLYRSVLARIKEKEREIRCRMVEVELAETTQPLVPTLEEPSSSQVKAIAPEESAKQEHDEGGKSTEEAGGEDKQESENQEHHE